jgi:xylonate dehydratase
VDYGKAGRTFSAEKGARVFKQRASRADLAADAALPDETRLWAALQDASGGTWGGCIFDVGSILKLLAAGKAGPSKGARLRMIRA